MAKPKTNLNKSQVAKKSKSHSAVSVVLSDPDLKKEDFEDMTAFFVEIALRVGLDRSTLIKHASPYRAKILARWNQLEADNSSPEQSDELEIMARQQAMIESQGVKLSEQHHRIAVLEKIISHSNIEITDTPDNAMASLAHTRKELDVMGFAFRALLAHVEELGILIVDSRLIDRGSGDGRILEICTKEQLSGYVRWTNARD
jgi:hypothetical protein